MSKDKFVRSKPHVNVGTIGHVDHGKTTLTAALVNTQAKRSLATAKSYSDIAKGGTVRDDSKTVTIASAHVGSHRTSQGARDASELHRRATDLLGCRYHPPDG